MAGRCSVHWARWPTPLPPPPSLSSVPRWPLLLLTLFCLVRTGCAGNPDAKRLYDDLLSRYNRLIRPVGNNSDTITVKMGLRLSQLIDVVSTGRGRRRVWGECRKDIKITGEWRI